MKKTCFFALMVAPTKEKRAGTLRYWFENTIITHEMFCLPLRGAAEKQSVARGTSAANSGTSAGIQFSLLNIHPSPRFHSCFKLAYVYSAAESGDSQHILGHLAHTSVNDPVPVLVSKLISVNNFCFWVD